MMDNLKENLKKTYQKLFITINDSDILFNDGVGIDGFSFIVSNETKINFSNSITDYTLEDGTMVQSGIINQPEIYEISGKVGELFLKRPITDFVNNTPIQSGLNTISAFLPELSNQAQQYYNQVISATNKIDNIYNNIDKSFNFLEGLTEGKTNQQKAFETIKTIWKNKNLFSIQTYFGIFNNCVIEECSFTQSNSFYETDINIRFKQMTFATNINSRVLSKAEINQIQTSAEKSKGLVSILKREFKNLGFI